MMIEQKKVKENSDIIIGYITQNHGMEISNKLSNSISNSYLD